MPSEAVLTWSDELFADAGRGIELCYQTLGEESDPPLVLIAGIGSQMVSWPDGFCEALARRGFHVIRFDNRDCGRSTWLTELGVPSVSKAWQRELDDPPYLLSDMAADCAGLLDALGHEAAHVVGISLGGFVAQTLAIEHPDRVASLASVMSSTGSGRVGQATPAALEALMTRPASDLEGYVDGIVAARRVIGSSGFEMDEALVRELAARAHGRGLNPEGTQRQLVASICSGNRTERLVQISAPTVVLHGADDPLIDVSGGRATAEAIPGAELVVIDGWGHDLPGALWERIADAIAANGERA
ncbi:MAG TPA: alpha/beta hydrolase [Solirubrobacterales bacterium]|nr:alpha/beta hydrolase [Solirubrobacterales bacterium]